MWLLPRDAYDPGVRPVMTRPAPPACPLYLALAPAAALTSTSLRERCKEPGDPDDFELAGTKITNTKTNSVCNIYLNKHEKWNLKANISICL